MAEGPTFCELINPDLAVVSGITDIFHVHQSPFQKIDVINTVNYGRCLILDGHMQSAEKDEYIFHESLIHPALISHPNPKTVFVGGGGEGATSREILRHKSVEKLVMVDIDGECVDVCKKYLPGHHKGSFEDPRLQLVIDDAKAYLERTTEKFDVLFFDLADPIEGGPCKLLYTHNFYKMCFDRLNEGGFLVTQSGPCGALTHGQVFTAINKTLSTVFPVVYGYGMHVPSFFDRWGFNLASKNKEFSPFKLTEEEVDKRLGALTKANELQFLDGATYKAIFILPKVVRETLAKEERIITEDATLVIP